MSLGAPLMTFCVPRVDRVDEGVLGRYTACKALTTQMAEFYVPDQKSFHFFLLSSHEALWEDYEKTYAQVLISAMFNQLPCLGV
jgi:hypothetical protein